MFVFPPCFNSGDTIYFPFDTFDSNGASVTITGLAVTDIECYKNGSVTQRSSDNGYALLDTDGIDFDGSTGLHGFSIDTSDNSDSGFWSDGAQYWVHVNAVTVDSQTVRFTYFLALGYTLRPTTAGRKLDVSAGGEAGIDWANVGSPTTTVSLSGTTVATVTTLTGHTPQTADHTANIAAILTDTGTTLQGELDGIQADTEDIQTRLPAALVGGRIDANVGAISSDATAADNAEAFFDGTGYAGTGNTIPIVTNVTNLHASAATASALSTASGYALAARNNTNYPDDYVIIDPVNGAAGTTPDTNGTMDNPSNSWADAVTIANARGIKKIRCVAGDWFLAGNAIASVDVSFFTIDLNGTRATIDPTTVTTSYTTWKNGVIDAAPRIQTGDRLININVYGRLDVYGTNTYLENCKLASVLWAGSTTTIAHVWLNCGAYPPGPLDTPVVFEFSSKQVQLALPGWYGDIHIKNFGNVADCILQVYGWGRLMIASSCAGGTVYYTSHEGAVDANGLPYSGAVVTVPVTSDYGEALVTTTIATLASQTSFTLSSGPPNTGAIPAGSLVIVQDATTEAQKCVGALSSYVVSGGGATLTVTLAADPGVFTMAVGDKVRIVPTVQQATINAEVVDALATDTYAEPTGAPGATVSLKDKIGYMYMALRNKLTITSSAKTFYDDGGSSEWSKGLADDGTTYTEAEGS